MEWSHRYSVADSLPGQADLPLVALYGHAARLAALLIINDPYEESLLCNLASSLMLNLLLIKKNTLTVYTIKASN